MSEEQRISSDPTLQTAETLLLLRSVPFFARAPEEELRAVAAHLRAVRFAEAESIVQEGEQGDACYIIRTGQAAVVSKDLTGQEITLATFSQGSCFGEVALVTEGKRTATVRAVAPVEAFVLHRADFARLEQACPTLSAILRHHVDLLAVDSFLKKASPLAHLPDEAIRQVAGQLRPQRAKAGEVIIQEGEEGETFYLVRDGRVEVLLKDKRLQVLEAGDCFGEVALLAQVKRTATVRALEDTELLVLAKPEFDAVVAQFPALQSQFREFIRIRVGATLANAIAATDPLATLMPNLAQHRRQRYWWLLIGGALLFGLLSLLSVQTNAPLLVYAALFVGSFLAPVVYVMYLAESHLLPESPINLGVTFVLAAALGIPLAIFLETQLGARHGALGSSFLVGIIEEGAKVLGVVWLLGRSRSRFQMDGVVYGAAAGMGFAAFENMLYGRSAIFDVSLLLSTLWWRTLLGPFGHGTWTAIICAVLWRQKEGGGLSVGLPVLAAFGFSVLLHTLWDWQPLQGALQLGWLLMLGVVGLVVLKELLDRATQEAVRSIVALNPQAAEASADATQLTCGSCGQLSPPGTRYCVRCGAALRAG